MRVFAPKKYMMKKILVTGGEVRGLSVRIFVLG